MRSTAGLMDHALPPADHEAIVAVLERFAGPQVHFHALQTREAGAHRFVSVHVLVPGRWTVQQGHDLLEDLEAAIEEALPGTDVHTHLEPVEDERAYKDAHLGLPLPPPQG
jgi:divalent metal cation (Fe/Co/Zn/Cd) transporter